MRTQWLRTKRRRKCPVCGKIDWCGISEDGSAAICMRVESDKPTHNGGWLHRLSDPIPVRITPQLIRESTPEFSTLWRRWSRETDFHHIDGFAMSLGVDTDALKSIGCAWSGRAWSFPMKDAVGEVIGIRLRSNEGQKWAVTGSRSGLFIPTSSPESTIFICEGPTDAAAGLTIGLYTIGRPACLGQEDLILDFIRRNKIRRVVIITDNDLPGLRGAAKLRGMLRIPSCQWVTPLKDLREFVQCGGQKADVESSISSLVWRVA